MCYNCSAGTYSTVLAATSAASCRHCLAGSKSSVSGASVCSDCRAGTFSSNASATCKLCPLGTYSIAYGLRTGWTVSPDDDTNQDRFISEDEFRMRFESSVWTDAQVGSLFARMDADRDGQLSLRPGASGFVPAELKLVGADWEAERLDALKDVVLQMDELNPVLEKDYNGKLRALELQKLQLELAPSARFNPLTGLDQIPPLQPASSDEVCHVCLPGAYSNLNGSSSCSWCAPGSYSQQAASRCTQVCVCHLQCAGPGLPAPCTSSAPPLLRCACYAWRRHETLARDGPRW